MPIGISLLLAACASGTKISAPVEPTTIEAPSPDKNKTSKASNRSAKPVLKKGGGFYKDDGPGEQIPEGLDDIPDAAPQLEPLHRFANKPYVVLGKSYTPNTRLIDYKVRGVASWYGKKFQGQKTSIGEAYDMFSMTAAHPTLALPSYVRVSNPSNGRSVVVRLTDRGPFHADRVIDLSYAAAYKLDLVNHGSGEVEVQAILPSAMVNPPEAQAAPSQLVWRSEPSVAPIRNEPNERTQHGLFIQLGAFASADNADSLRAHLLRELDWLEEKIQINAGNGLYRIHLGPYASRLAAETVVEKIRSNYGYKPTLVKR
ncbi:MAG: septal ring lytic transglycosylase RlpA family protein [Pseudomonadota bacterium]